MQKIFWDTNVFLDVAQQRPYELAESNLMFEESVAGKLEIFVSESVITTALYFSKTKAAQLTIGKVLDWVEVLPIDKDTIKKALSSSFKDKEDAVLYHLAVLHGMDCLVTRNAKDFLSHAQPVCEVLTPKGWVEKYLDR